MGSISERQTAKDRISNLPNNIIAHILSFLSTDEAVRTSTLSTNWYKKWALSNNVKIDDGLLMRQNSQLRNNPNPRSGKGFVNFVYRVLLFKVTPLHNFRLRCGLDYGVLNVSQWISAALSRDVREIDIWAPLLGRVLVNERLFSSKTLVVLLLGMGFVLKVPEIVSLESLKVLHLYGVQFEDGESLARLVSSCPVLRELKIETPCLSETVNVLNISSPVLESLILIGLHTFWALEIRGAHSYKVVLNTPNLRYLEYDDGGVLDGYHIESTLNCLDEAWLCVVLCSTQIDQYDDKQILARSMAPYCCSIQCSDSLFIRAFYHPDCVLPNFQLPIFPRLTKLDIGAIVTGAGLSLLTSFLQSSPQLTSLSFALEKKLKLEFWDPPTDVPSCMLFSLKVIKVVYYCEPEPVLSMVKYFLEKTDCLKELIIPLMKVENVEFIEKVIFLPRASNSCKIVLI